MANTKSAAKRVRVTEKRTLQNRMWKSAMRTAVRRYQEALAGQDPTRADALLRRAVSLVDKAATKGVIHRNTAARKKARLSRRLRQTATV